MEPIDRRTVLLAFCVVIRTIVPVSAAGPGFPQTDACRFRCPGSTKPVPRPAHRSSANGCGTGDFKIPASALPHPEFETCCNRHDICYDTCGENRTSCDEIFEKCMTGVCQTRASSKDNCLATSRLFTTMTAEHGCDPFLKSQKKACVCRATDEL
uniref:Putative phospholipase a2 group xii n=1 Tax=Ixodes ricinus TaxID=34613 RepID=A0A6B0UWN1_IXORI